VIEYIEDVKNMKYKIEKANNSQIKELLELSKKVTNQNSRTYLPNEMIDHFLESPFFISEITDNIDNMTIIKDNKKIIGLCVFKESELVTLMLDPNYQNKGIATYFLTEVTNAIFKTYEEITLECFETNKVANKFYQKNGFIKYKTVLDEDLEIMKNLYRKER